MYTAAWKQSLQYWYGRVLAALHNGLAAVGILAILFFILQADRIGIEPSPAKGSAFGSVRYESGALFFPADDLESPRHRALANYLSRRYKVAYDATEGLVGAAFEVGQQVGLDPLLILAVMAIESRFNPIAESVMGAKGLMQVIPKLHRDKLEAHGGEDAVLNPATNILVGARILKEYIRRTGNLEAGLQLYAGALSDTSSQYAEKVIAEKERLRQTLRRYELSIPKGPQA